VAVKEGNPDRKGKNREKCRETPLMGNVVGIQKLREKKKKEFINILR